MTKQSDNEKRKKEQALEGKSYLLEKEENDPRKKEASNEGSEYIERNPDENDANHENEKADYDKVKGNK